MIHIDRFPEEKRISNSTGYSFPWQQPREQMNLPTTA